MDGLVQNAVRGGAVLATGGRGITDGALGTGLFHAPTVITRVRDEMPIAREEIFGSVAPVMTFRDEAEVIARSNATPFGLAAYFYTREIPFGGFKESGIGREGGHQGTEEYMEVKSISIGM